MRPRDRSLISRILAASLALAAAAFPQSGGLKVVLGAVDARGRQKPDPGLENSGDGRCGDRAQHRPESVPEGPLPAWWVPEFKRTFDLANHRARTDEHRTAMSPFALATDLRPRQVLDGDIRFNIDAAGRAQRAGVAAAADRRIEMLATPVTVLRAALDLATRSAPRARRATMMWLISLLGRATGSPSPWIE